MDTNQRIIIFGGPDRCGKTTIAKALSKALDIPYFKPVNQQWYAINDPTVFKKQTEFGEPKLLDFLKQTGYSAIMDRGFPCDYAYSTVLGRDTAWETIWALDAEYGRMNAVLVVTLRTDYASFKDEWDQMTLSKTRALDKAYRAYAAQTSMKSVIIMTNPDPASWNLKAQVTDIIEALN